MAKLVSKVYGDALFEAALEENQLDAVWDEVREIASILQENEAFIDIMNHPEMTSLLGGIRIRIDDRVVDNTIRTKLEEMTRKLSKVRV